MGQIHGPSLGSPACQVTSTGELLVSLSSGGNQILIDELTGTLTNTDYIQHTINEGSHYAVHTVSNFRDPGSVCFVIETPSGTNAPKIHMNFSVDSTGESYVKEFENVITSGGTTGIPINSNRTSSNTSEVALVLNPAVTSSGLLLGEWAFGIDSKKGAVGGAGERSNEIILNPGSKYMWCMVATAGSVIINEDGYWYENGN